MEKAGASDLLRGPKALTGQVRCGDPTTDKLAPAAQHHFRIFSVMSRHRDLVKGSKLSILLALSSLDVVRNAAEIKGAGAALVAGTGRVARPPN